MSFCFLLFAFCFASVLLKVLRAINQYVKGLIYVTGDDGLTIQVES